MHVNLRQWTILTEKQSWNVKKKELTNILGHNYFVKLVKKKN